MGIRDQRSGIGNLQFRDLGSQGTGSGSAKFERDQVSGSAYFVGSGIIISGVRLRSLLKKKCSLL